MSAVIRALGLSRGPGNWRTVYRRIAELKLDATHLRGQAHGTTKPNNKRELSEIMREGTSYSASTLKRRLIAAGRIADICVECGLGPSWNGKPITLQHDHKNGDPFDNRFDNLRVLCPNCHAQTPTYKGGKLRGRYSRPENRCVDCNTKINRAAERCFGCHTLNLADKRAWPPAVELARIVEKTSYRAAAAGLGVSDNAVRKFLLRRLGTCPRKKRAA